MKPTEMEALSRELEFLKQNPHFDQRPATIIEFLGPEYLNIADKVRPGVRRILVEIFGSEPSGRQISRKRRAMFTGAIGIGKTTFASIAIPYMVHWVECLKDPQAYFNLLPGSRIAFMLMSTSDSQAKEVLFGDIKARINISPWFKAHCQSDPNFKNQIRFPKDIWVLPGNSAETTFEGYNILGGILDEGDSHKVTDRKDFAEAGYDTIHARISSRFIDEETGDHRGLLIAIGQMKKSSGFMARKAKELEKDPGAVVGKMTIWESLGWDKFLDAGGERRSFFYDTKRKKIIPKGVMKLVDNSNLIEVPTAYLTDFENKPEKALRDLAGIPPASEDTFISLTDRIDECVERWEERYPDLGSPVGTHPAHPEFAQWLIGHDSLRRALHIDMAVSAEGDALGLAMGHVRELVEVEDELKPYIVFDFLLRIKASPGTEIIIGDVRRMIYELKDDRKFRIKKVTMDGFQSTDTRQQLNKRRIASEYLSVDKQLLPYHDLREAIYERRLEFPPYMTYLNLGDAETVEIAKKELYELSEAGNKVDHPAGGSKDVADAMAGVVYTLMGDRSYRRVGARSAPSGQESNGMIPQQPNLGYGGLLAGLGGMSAPIPPSTSSIPGMGGMWR